MPRRPTWSFGLFPTRLEPVKFFEAHQDWVERAGRNARALAKRIAVMPLAGMDEEGVQDGQRLTRETDAEAHALTLPR